METVAAKVPADLADEIEEYRQEHDLNTSQAMRRLLEEGVESQEKNTNEVNPFAYSLLVSGVFILGASPYVTATGTYIGELSLGMILVAFLMMSQRAHQYAQVLKSRLTRQTDEEDAAATA